MSERYVPNTDPLLHPHPIFDRELYRSLSVEEIIQALAAAQEAQREAGAAVARHYDAANRWQARAEAAEAERDDYRDAAACEGHLADDRQRERDEAIAALARAREALEQIMAEAEGCTRLPEPNAYDYEAAIEKTIEDLLLDHAEIARAALEATQPRADDTPASGTQQSSNDTSPNDAN